MMATATEPKKQSVLSKVVSMPGTAPKPRPVKTAGAQTIGEGAEVVISKETLGKVGANPEAERNALLDSAQASMDKVGDKQKRILRNAQEVIRLCHTNKSAAADDKPALKGQALGVATVLLEDIEEAQITLKTQQRNALSRLKTDFGYEPADIRKLLKERKKPKEQFALDLKMERTNMDKLHETAEANGATRIADERTTKRRTQD